MDAGLWEQIQSQLAGRPLSWWLAAYGVLATALYAARPQAHAAIRAAFAVAWRALRLAQGWLSARARALGARYRALAQAHRERRAVQAAARAAALAAPQLERALPQVQGLAERARGLLAEVQAGLAHATAPADDEVAEGDVPEGEPAGAFARWRAGRRLRAMLRRQAEARVHALAALQPPLRQALETLGRIETRVQESGRVAAEAREAARRALGESARPAEGSVGAQLAVAMLLSGAALLGALLNGLLIARPMAEMVGTGSTLLGWPINAVAAGVFVLLELALGYVIMEALGYTHLLGLFDSVPDRSCRRLLWLAGCLLVALALAEAGLAYVRELLIAEEARTTALLAGGDATAADRLVGALPTAVQAVLGFVLPLVLAVTAVPLERLAVTGRIAIQWLLWNAVATAAFLARLGAVWARSLRRLTLGLYDLAAFPPLALERLARAGAAAARAWRTRS